MVVAIALFFGASGIPLSFWLLRQEKLSSLDKLFLGYTLGWAGVPLIFTFETVVGILYSPIWMWINWLALLLAGIILLVVDKVLPEPEKILAGINGAASAPLDWLKEHAVPMAMLFIVALAVWLCLSASGGLLYELDPYYYLEGVHEVVAQGHNYLNDGTAWFPLTVSSHLGNPLYKYLLASWYSLYNGAAQYSPYTLMGVGSVYPPLAAGLTVFFAYLLFREIYERRAGLLAAGLTAFLPFFLLKFQGGDAQIVPYSLFALFFFLAMLYMALKRESMKLTFLCAFAYGAIVLGSNVDILITFCLSLFFFGMSLRYISKPDEKGLRQCAVILSAIFVFQLVYLVYMGSFDIGSLLENIFMSAGMPILAFAFPLAMNWAIGRFAPKTGTTTRMVAIVACVLLLIIVLPYLTPLSHFLSEAEIWGAYTIPLSRTIAEQAPGSASYDSVFGFIAMTFSGSLPGLLSSLFNLINVIPTLIFNFVFNSIAALLNSFLSFSNGQPANFPAIDRTNSLLTLFFFWGFALLLVSLLKPIRERRQWPIYALLLLAFMIPTTFMGLEKSKLETYLGITLIFAVVAFFGEAAELLERRIPHCSELMWVLVIVVLLLEFGFPIAPAPAWAASILSSSFTPTFQQAPQATAQRFSEICNQTDQQLCTVEPDLAAIMADPTQFFDSDLCILSLWTNTSAVPSYLVPAIQYRCSFINSYWVDSMDWINANVPTGERIISWWDYGHWINFFGMRNSTLRNDHLSPDMIGRTAYSYLDGTPADLIETMNAYSSRYALMDIEIVGSGPDRGDISFGAKYSALNYLACAYANQTNVSVNPGSSLCEADHLWETIVIPVQGEQCTVSESKSLTGFVAYEENYTSGAASPAYCAVVGTLLNGQQSLITYDLNQTDAQGDMLLHPAIWVLINQDNTTLEFNAIYDNEQLWTDQSGNLVSSYPYRTTAFYNSTLYQGFMLGSIPGFDLVYDTPDVRIFRMQDAYYKPAG